MDAGGPNNFAYMLGPRSLEVEGVADLPKSIVLGQMV